MSSKIIRRIAVVLGAGMALGATSASFRQSAKRRKTASTPAAASADVLSIEPLLDRLEVLESRIANLPVDLQIAPSPEPIARAEDFSELRSRIAEHEARAERAAERMEARFAGIRAEVPVLLEQGLTARIEQLRIRLMADLEERQETALRNFETALDEKVSRSIAGIEKKLAEQSAVLASITTRSAQTDEHLQRLIGAVQKLLDRTSTSERPPDAPVASLLDLPFQAHLEQAMANTEEAGQVRETSGRRRMPMAPMMMLVFTLGLRLFR